MIRLRNPDAVAVLLLVVVGAGLYSTNLQNPLFWDDNELIVSNPRVHSLTWPNVGRMFTEDLHGGSGLPTNYYRPLLLLGFAFNYAVSGVQPLGYHAASNALHIASSLLVFLILAAATGRRLVGFLAALLFLIHPLQTEAVTYVSGRGDPLHLGFLLLSLGLFYLAERRGVGWTAWPRPLSLALLVLGLLSHEKAIVFPLLIVVFSLAFLSRGTPQQELLRAVGRALPYFAVVLVYGICRLTVLNFVDTLDFHAMPSEYSQQLHVRLFTFLHVLLVDYRLIVAPVGLHMERTVPLHRSFLDLEVWSSFLLLAALVGALIALGVRDARRTNVGLTSFRIWLFGAGWLFATLGPVSGITPINALIYEHWLYVGLIGPATIAAWYATRAMDALVLARRRTLLAGLSLALAAYCAFLAATTVGRNRLWGQPLPFFEDILRYEPDNVSVNNNLGNEYYDRGDLERAEFHYKLAATGQQSTAHPHYNLGVIYEDRGQDERAIAQYEQALAIDPRFYFGLQKLVEVHSRRGEFAEVLRWLEPLKKLRPQDPHVFYNAALAYQYLGQSERAQVDARRALALAADDSDPAITERIRELLRALGD